MFTWMKSLVMYLILSGICINLSPGRNYKRYISFFTGIVIIIIVAQPLSYIAHLSRGDIGKITDSMDGYLSESSSVKTFDSMYDYYEMSLAKSVEITLLESGCEVKEISVIADENNNPQRLYVYVDKGVNEDSMAAEDKIKKVINEVYNVDMSSIYVVRR